MRNIFRTLPIITLVVMVALSFIHRDEILLNISKIRYVFLQPCGMIFADTMGPWGEDQKSGVIEACENFKKAGMNKLFFQPLYLFLDTGASGASAGKSSIVFTMSKVTDTAVFKSVALHEIAHVIDQRSGNLSTKMSWLLAADWSCPDTTDLESCTHPCKQTADKSFYCNFREHETLPSRYGSLSYDPEHTDVSINPAEDFAEASRYFFEANDALQLTSPSRCAYFRVFYGRLSDDPCYDCDPNTACVRR